MSPEVVRSLLNLLEHKITLVVPLRGSVSASGDLLPLSYIAGALEGSPDIYVQVQESPIANSVVTAYDALVSKGLDPRVMGPKESLSVVDGTSSTAALAALVMFESQLLSVLVQALSVIAVEALAGNSESFHPFISATRPHSGQIECTCNVSYLLQGSRLAQNMNGNKDRNRSGLIQDRYALRSVTQWIGPQLEDLQLAHHQIEVELNSSCDNPLVDVESNDAYYGCNFQAASTTSAMEKTRITLQMLRKIIFAQATEIVEPHLNNGLPTNLVADNPDFSFTMKGVDTNMAAYMAELAYLAHPLGACIQAAEMHNHSVNSMALASSLFAMDAVEILSIICACHLYVSCQALDLRALQLKFIEQSPAILAELSGQIFASLPNTTLRELEIARTSHNIDNWPKTNSLAIEERCGVVAGAAMNIIIDSLSYHGPVSRSSVTDLTIWT